MQISVDMEIQIKVILGKNWQTGALCTKDKQKSRGKASTRRSTNPNIFPQFNVRVITQMWDKREQKDGKPWEIIFQALVRVNAKLISCPFECESHLLRMTSCHKEAICREKHQSHLAIVEFVGKWKRMEKWNNTCDRNA